MKKLYFALLTFSLALTLCACGTSEKPVETAPVEPPASSGEITASEEPAETGSEVTAPEKPAEADSEAVIDLSGPWHLDSEKNDLTAFQDIFPAYAEFGASMEIKSSGQISWYIGAEGGAGTYTLDGDTLTADLISDTDQQPATVLFHVILDGEAAQLKMDYNGTDVYWVYGDSEEPSASGE